jgi:hypothetical protein
MTRQTIPPGESTELSTRLTLAGRSGELHKTILVESNDPANPALQLALVGKTSEDFVIQPSVLVLRKDSHSHHASGAVQIRATDGSAFEISELVSTSGKLKLRADPMPEGNAYQISANFDEEIPVGEHSDQVTISTNLKGGKTATIGALVLIPAPITIAPAKIVLEENPESTVSRTIILKSPKNEKLEISHIETPDPKVTTQIQPLGDFGVRVVLGNISPSRDLDSKVIVIHLASGQVVEIPIHIKTRPLPEAQLQGAPPIRKPVLSSSKLGSATWLSSALMESDGSAQEPPRITRIGLPELISSASVHSRTFPPWSKVPNGPGLWSKNPTGVVSPKTPPKLAKFVGFEPLASGAELLCVG